MTPVDIALIQSSFAKVAPIREQAAAIFYARLFECAPSLSGVMIDAAEASAGRVAA